MTDRTLKQYVRDRKGNPRGVVVATVIDDEVRFGWSYANTKAGDSFKKELGMRIALNRAERGYGKTVKVPHSVNKAIKTIEHRARRYFANTGSSSQFEGSVKA